MNSQKPVDDDFGKTSCSSSGQLMLLFNSRRIEPKVLVRLSDPDKRYHYSCIAKDIAFGESFLKETRAQRLGCSVRDLECMVNYERNRHLAEEAISMRLSSWETDPVTYIDWTMINARANRESMELADAFAEFRKRRLESFPLEKKVGRRKAV